MKTIVKNIIKRIARAFTASKPAPLGYYDRFAGMSNPYNTKP